jgi:hypothetical protein
MSERIRAVGLLSGGLDSALAAKLMLEQGIDVVALHLQAPTACRTQVAEVARDLGIRLEVRQKGEEYLKLLRNPRFGYGKNMNPCIDCRVFMFGLARTFMDEVGASFLFTGEVVGQRPMSQMRNTIFRIDHEAGLEGQVLRPLSARLLPETEPERSGWVDRARLLGLAGRGRREQLALAERYGLRSYQSPGGGCLLTDEHFSSKLRDLFAHTPQGETDESAVRLLRLGRHFRIAEDTKVVLGRDQQENAALRDYVSPRRHLVEPDGFHGPHALVCGPLTPEAVEAAGRLIARYTRRLPDGAGVRYLEGGELRRVAVSAEGDELIHIEPPSPRPLAV